VVEETGDILSLNVYERNEWSGPRASVIVQFPPDWKFRLHSRASTSTLEEAVSLADQALWAWASGGTIGLQAYLMTRQDRWTDYA
jgi:hypothetical protein